jgi:hypothetical protein
MQAAVEVVYMILPLQLQIQAQLAVPVAVVQAEQILAQLEQQVRLILVVAVEQVVGMIAAHLLFRALAADPA